MLDRRERGRNRRIETNTCCEALKLMLLTSHYWGERLWKNKVNRTSNTHASQGMIREHTTRKTHA
jgi:hypothetical protein